MEQPNIYRSNRREGKQKRSPSRLSGEPAISGSEIEAQVGMGVGTAPLAGLSDEGDPFMETKVIWELDIAKLAFSC